jgi:hypothetical protein
MREGALPGPLDRRLEEEDARVSEMTVTETGRNCISLEEARRRLLQRRRKRRGGCAPRLRADRCTVFPATGEQSG